MDKLSAVRTKIIEAATGADPKPTTPVVFSLLLLSILDESDFAVLDKYEAEAGEQKALEWFQATLAEVGVQLRAEGLPELREGRGRR